MVLGYIVTMVVQHVIKRHVSIGRPICEHAKVLLLIDSYIFDMFVDFMNIKPVNIVYVPMIHCE